MAHGASENRARPAARTKVSGLATKADIDRLQAQLDGEAAHHTVQEVFALLVSHAVLITTVLALFRFADGAGGIVFLIVLGVLLFWIVVMAAGALLGEVEKWLARRRATGRRPDTGARARDEQE